MREKILLTPGFWDYLSRACRYYDSHWPDQPQEHYARWMADTWGIAHRRGHVRVIDPAKYALFLLKFGS